VQKKHGIGRSFGFAFKGIAIALGERNFVIHLIAALLVVFLGFAFRISHLEWISLLICISSVLCLELINTAIEKTIDLLHPQQHPKAGEIKDLAAASVLVAVIISVIIGVIIFIPKILNLINV